MQGRDTLQRYDALTRLLDEAFRVPGTRWRFGLDPLLGLVPGLGDLIGAAVGAYGVLAARQLGAPLAIQLRMLGNIALDAFAGSIPLVGDVTDFFFKANRRNRDLLARWLESPHSTRRRTLAGLLGILALLALVLAGAAALTIWCIVALLRFAQA